MGRSGTMYGYEGIGCIYWHMVSKLLLAVQEITLRAFDEPCQGAVREKLVESYYRIRAGLGFEKTAAEYGAFPTDPYSHTPPHAGAQQPGMTGQVKEEIITRFGELGVTVKEGCLSFRPRILKRSEFLTGPRKFEYYCMDATRRVIDISEDTLAFTFCQVPVIYRAAPGKSSIAVTRDDGSRTVFDGDTLDIDNSRAVFDRTGNISMIEVEIPESSLLV